MPESQDQSYFSSSQLAVNLSVKQLSCERDGRNLFDGVCLDVNPGDVVRIEGPNGSGKTTFLRIVCGLSSAYEGELYWHERPLQQVRQSFYASTLYLGHAAGIKESLTPIENLRWLTQLRTQPSAGAFSESDAMSALADVGLCGYEDLPCYQLSAGQKRRVALARLYLNPPPLWVLDEPFTAIDRQGVKQLEQLIADHCRRGGAVILTTHHELDIPKTALETLCLSDYEVLVHSPAFVDSLEAES